MTEDGTFTVSKLNLVPRSWQCYLRSHIFTYVMMAGGEGARWGTQAGFIIEGLGGLDSLERQ